MIRPFRPVDAALLKTLMSEFYRSPAVLHPVPEAYFDRTIRELMAGSPYAEAYLFDQEDVPAGYGLLAKTYSNEAGGLVVWIEEIYIRESCRGSGLGSAFLRFVEDAYAGKAARLRLEVEADNTGAIRLYERRGYRELPYRQMIRETACEEGGHI